MFREMRRKKQEVNKNECVNILKTEKRGVVSVIGDHGYPYAVPINFYYDEENEKVYFHCAKEGHKIDAMKNCSKVCFTTWNEGVKKEGDWAFYVTSVIIMGEAKLISDEETVYDKVRKLGLKYYPAEEEVDEEISRDIKRVQLVEINIEHMTGKLVHEK